MSAHPLPAPAELERLLHDITERLASELSSPGLRPPEWSTLEWTLARAVAAIHGVSPLLASALAWRGPADWHAFLDAQRQHTLERHRRLAHLLETIAGAATTAGLPFLALKGAALHSAGLYRPGERPMADLDLLVPWEVAPGFAALLESLELRIRGSDDPREVVFRPKGNELQPVALGEHRDNGLKIDLHTQVAATLPLQSVDLTGHLLPERLRPGMNPYVSSAALMAHLLLHAAGDMVSKVLRLLQLNDLALVASLMTEADWEALLSLEVQGRGAWWAYPPLRLTDRYFVGLIPERVLERLAAECPASLRRAYATRHLADVSFSHPWVDAFPGLEWTSFFDHLRYAAQRLVRNADLRRRPAAHASEFAADGLEWSRLTQLERVRRYLRGRALRPGTLRVVQAALGGRLGCA